MHRKFGVVDDLSGLSVNFYFDFRSTFDNTSGDIETFCRKLECRLRGIFLDDNISWRNPETFVGFALHWVTLQLVHGGGVRSSRDSTPIAEYSGQR